MPFGMEQRPDLRYLRFGEDAEIMLRPLLQRRAPAQLSGLPRPRRVRGFTISEQLDPTPTNAARKTGARSFGQGLMDFFSNPPPQFLKVIERRDPPEKFS